MIWCCFSANGTSNSRKHEWNDGRNLLEDNFNLIGQETEFGEKTDLSTRQRPQTYSQNDSSFLKNKVKVLAWPNQDLISSSMVILKRSVTLNGPLS